MKKRFPAFQTPGCAAYSMTGVQPFDAGSRALLWSIIEMRHGKKDHYNSYPGTHLKNGAGNR
jgi:hypothetical protein